MDSILICENVTKRFGSFTAVDNLCFEVLPNEILGIAGPNGAGKTTLFNMITKLTTLSSGKVKFEDRYIYELPANKICELGIARTFQIPHCFPGMSVLENIKVGCIFGCGHRGSGQEHHSMEPTDILDFVGLRERKDAPAEKLSLFEMKLLMLGSALATKPKLLLLDEPMGGLSITEIHQSMKLIRQVFEQGVTIIIIEHLMNFLVDISDHLMILCDGKKLTEGKPSQIIKDSRVIKAYLGEKFKHN